MPDEIETENINQFEQVHYNRPDPATPNDRTDGIHWIEYRGGVEYQSGYSATWPVEEPPNAPS